MLARGIKKTKPLRSFWVVDLINELDKQTWSGTRQVYLMAAKWLTAAPPIVSASQAGRMERKREKKGAWPWSQTPPQALLNNLCCYVPARAWSYGRKLPHIKATG